MTLVSKIAISSVAVVVICGAAVTWHSAKARAARKLVEEANATRMRAEQGDANSEYQLASLYFQGKGVAQSYGDAVGWYRKSGEQGNKNGEYGIGYMYYWGLGVQQDYGQAFNWYRKAAEDGNAKAQYDLAFMYHEGKGLPQDRVEALNWCRKAADQGYAKAEYALGSTYYEGKDVPQDYGESARWYREAARQGYPQAESYLGYMYSHGMGLPRDYGQAAYWYRKAASQGDEYARRALRSMAVPLGPLSVVPELLGSALLLLASGGNFRNRQQRAMGFGGLFVLLCVGLNVYGHLQFGTLLAFSAVNAFFFAKGILSAIWVAILARIAWPRGFKVVLATIGIGFIGFNIYAAARYDFRYLAACPPAFYETNGWLIGTAIALAVLRWYQREPAETLGDNQRLASGAQPLGT